MTTKTFSIGDIINDSWSIIKKNIWIFAGSILGISVIIFLIIALTGGLGAITAGSHGDVQSALGAMFGFSMIIMMLLIFIIAAVFSVGYYKMALIAADGLEPTFAAFSTSLKKILNVLFASFIYVILVYIGLFLCIIPGFIVLVRLQLTFFFIIDKDYGAIEAISKSWNATEGETINLLLLFLAFYLINMLGMLCCGIGMLVTAPMQVIGMALVYRTLTGGKPMEANFEELADQPNV